MSLFHRRLYLTRAPPIVHFNKIRTFSQQQIVDASPLVCRLASRSVIRFRGPDTIKFLKGLLTNEVDPSLSFPSSSELYLLMYTALLTPQGRFLYDLFFYHSPSLDRKLNESGNGRGLREQQEAVTLHADVDASFLDEILVCFRK